MSGEIPAGANVISVFIGKT